MRVSVILVTWNGRPLLERFLPSVLSTEYPDVEVLVADNASTDDTVAWLGATHPEVRVVSHPENWLFARGNNAAVAHAKGDILVFLNNDVEVHPGWLGPLVESLSRQGVGACQPKLLQWADRTRFEYAGASGGFLDRYGFPFTRGRLFESMEIDHGQYDDARDVFWATGAAFAIRRDVFLDAGGFDEAFGMHMEEIDLCWRLQRQGWRIRVEPTSEVYHLGGASLPSGSPRKTFLNFRNNLAMLAKNLPDAHLAPVLRARRAFDAAAAGRAAVAGQREDARAIRSAWRAFRTVLPALPRPNPHDPVVLPPYRGSVVLDHYARRCMAFADLPTRHWAEGWKPPPSTADIGAPLSPQGGPSG